ncbi:ABC transporter substrate-binding protein [Roseiarcaceae bacterium H3SJ34-1]|uniref:ABC transporter substrate-binding protein n=1 Tax=Terripilifer ovatus TaxID=3032367 RepID=UPI003AB9A28B|nr:ABC transporter substrate-binding protein [Roseiarcaceae bacterium H3SJ34-1]
MKADVLKQLVLAGSLVLAGAAHAQTPAQTPALAKVKVGKSGGPMILTIVDVGTEAGIWKAQGLDVESIYFGGESQTMVGLASGSIDFGFGSGPGLAYPVKGVPVTAIAAVSGAPYNMVVTVAVNSPIKSLADLRGKKLGVTSAGSLTDWMAKEIGRSQGWGNEGVLSFPTGGSRTSIAAMRAGDLDGVVMGAATGFDAQLNKQGRVLAPLGHIVKDFHSNVLFARNEMIAKSPETVQRFVDGWFKSVAYAKANPDFTIKVSAATLNISQDSARAAYEDEITMMARDKGGFDKAAIETIRRSLREIGTLADPPPAEKLYDERFLAGHK